MADMKKLLESCVQNGFYETLGELYGTCLMENIVFEKAQGKIFDNSKETFEELKKLMPIWKEKYGFDENTTLKEVLEKAF